FIDAETGETLSQKWSSAAPHTLITRDGKEYGDDKALGKAHTYAEKYFLLRTFMITSKDDPDLDQNNDRAAPKLAPKVEPPAQPTNGAHTHWSKDPTRFDKYKGLLQQYGLTFIEGLNALKVDALEDASEDTSFVKLALEAFAANKAKSATS